MLRELPDLVIRQPYAFLVREGEFPGRWPMKAVLWLYDFLAGIRDHRWIGREQLLERIPGLSPNGLARRDDLHRRADRRRAAGVAHFARGRGGRRPAWPITCGWRACQRQGARFSVVGARSKQAAGRRRSRQPAVNRRRRRLGRSRLGRGEEDQALARQPPVLPARPSADGRLHHGAAPEGQAPRLYFPLARRDRCRARPISTMGAALGGAALHGQRKWNTSSRLIRSLFPGAAITPADVVSTMAGVRPVIASGKGLNPSQESREHSIWQSRGHGLRRGRQAHHLPAHRARRLAGRRADRRGGA